MLIVLRALEWFRGAPSSQDAPTSNRPLLHGWRDWRAHGLAGLNVQHLDVVESEGGQRLSQRAGRAGQRREGGVVFRDDRGRAEQPHRVSRLAWAHCVEITNR